MSLNNSPAPVQGHAQMDIDSIINHPNPFTPPDSQSLSEVALASLMAVEEHEHAFDNTALVAPSHLNGHSLVDEQGSQPHAPGSSATGFNDLIHDNENDIVVSDIEVREQTVVDVASDDGGDADYIDNTNGVADDDEDEVEPEPEHELEIEPEPQQEPESEVQGQPAGEPQYSKNPHTVKARKRQARLTGASKFEESARLADHKALGLARRKVMAKSEYQNATKGMKEMMLEKAMLEKKEERMKKGIDCASKMRKYYAGEAQYRAGLAGPATLNPIPQFMAREGMAPRNPRPGPNRTIGARTGPQARRNTPAPVVRFAPVADMGDSIDNGSPEDEDMANGDSDAGMAISSPFGRRNGDVTFTRATTIGTGNRRTPIKRQHSPDFDLSSIPSILGTTHNRRPDQATTITLAKEIDALRGVMQNLVNGLGSVRNDQGHANTLLSSVRNDLSLTTAQVSLYKGQADTMMAQLPKMSNSISSLEATVGFSNSGFGGGNGMVNGHRGPGLLGDLEHRVEGVEESLRDLRERIGQGDAVELRRARTVLRGFAGVLNSTYSAVNDKYGGEVDDGE